MTLDINELERLLATLQSSSWNIADGAQLIMTLRNHLPEIVVRLKAAEEMREALGEYACAGFDKCPKYGTSNECERRMMALDCGDDARKAIAAYDKAKG